MKKSFVYLALAALVLVASVSCNSEKAREKALRKNVEQFYEALKTDDAQKADSLRKDAEQYGKELQEKVMDEFIASHPDFPDVVTRFVNKQKIVENVNKLYKAMKENDEATVEAMFEEAKTFEVPLMEEVTDEFIETHPDFRDVVGTYVATHGQNHEAE